MTGAEFLKHYIKDQEHSKRSKLHKEGHTDEEMAIACKVDVKEIRAWRKEHRLRSNTVFTVKARKDDSVMRKGSFTRFEKGCGQI